MTSDERRRRETPGETAIVLVEHENGEFTIEIARGKTTLSRRVDKGEAKRIALFITARR